VAEVINGKIDTFLPNDLASKLLMGYMVFHDIEPGVDTFPYEEALKIIQWAEELETRLHQFALVAEKQAFLDIGEDGKVFVHSLADELNTLRVLQGEKHPEDCAVCTIPDCPLSPAYQSTVGNKSEFVQ